MGNPLEGQPQPMRMNRRALLGLGLKIATAPIVVAVGACARPQDESNFGTQVAIGVAAKKTVISLKSETPNAKSTKTPQAVITSTPEVQKTSDLEYRAKKLGFNQWIIRMDGTQVIKGTGTYAVDNTLQAHIENRNPWDKYFAQILESNTHPDNPPLKVKWTLTKMWEHPYAGGTTKNGQSIKGYQGTKYTGEVEIANIKIGVGTRPLNNIDKLNELLWDGGFSVQFARRFRGTYTSQNNWSANPEAVKRWLSSPETSSSSQFSPWGEEMWSVSLKNEKGEWKPTEKRTDYGNAAGLFLPSEVLSYSCQALANPDDIIVCKKIDPPK